MCGIYGVTLDPQGSAVSTVGALAEVRRAVAGLAHRGPGERSVVPAGAAVLGTARLHVTAPGAPSGPYSDARGSVIATVNGEIWNHAELAADLRARGVAVPAGADTAIVAPLYAEFGVAGLARLRGMFGLALHDARTGCTVLARDRLGIKPLYYQTSDGRRPLRFASEFAALPGGGGVDAAALADYLALGFVPAPATLDRAVRKVRPGTALVFERGRPPAEVRFAGPPAATHGAAPSPDRVRDALERAVGRHLMGDAPIGVYLSGGLDSAAIAALVSRAGAPLRTFAMAFPGEGAYDEGDAARRSADLLGATHTQVSMSARDLPGLLRHAARHFGEPFGDPSALAVLALSREATRHVTVVLTGTGADELFAGYGRYRHGRYVPGLGAAAAAGARCLPASRRSRLGTVGALLDKYARSATRDPAERYLARLSVVPAAWRSRLLGGATPPPVLGRLRDAFARAGSFADGGRLADLDVYLPDDLLAKEDRMAMACSLENRVPFLDDEVIDLAAGATAHAQRTVGGRTRGAGRGKRLLRRALRGVLPDEILGRRKHGFAVPVSEWLRGPLAHLADDMLLASDARVRDLVDDRALADLVRTHRAGDESLGLAVHALLALEASFG